MEDLKKKCLMLPIITKDDIIWNIPQGNSKVKIKYPSFNDKILSWMNLMEELELIDSNYMDNYLDVENKSSGDLSIEEILTIYTYCVRGERLCGGIVVKMIQTGKLEKLGKRLFELCSK